MKIELSGLYVILGFVAISGTILFWKLVRMAIEEMTYRNNRD